MRSVRLRTNPAGVKWPLRGAFESTAFVVTGDVRECYTLDLVVENQNLQGICPTDRCTAVLSKRTSLTITGRGTER